jgi:polyphosphate kinase
MDDRSDSWELTGDGTWHRRPTDPTQPRMHLQEALLRRISGKVG